MTDIVTVEQLQNASLDADSLQLFVSGTDIQEVLTRLGQQYPTLAKLVRLLMETGGWKAYQTEAELLATVPLVSPSVGYAFDTKKLYLWDGSIWVDEGISPWEQQSALLENEKLERESLIKKSTEQGLAIYGDDFFETARFNDQTARLHNVIEIQNHGNEVVFFGFDYFEMGRIKISDADNLIKKSIDTEIVVVGSDYFEVGRLAYIDQDYAAVIDTSQPLIYAQPLCAFSAKPLVLNVPSLFAQRKDQCKTRQVLATLSGQSSQLSYSSRDQINVPNLSDVGTGFITLRDTTQYQLTRIPYTARIAATSGKSAVSPKILMIGDSITNRGLVDLINQYLTGYTYTQTFVGTMNGALNSEPSTGIGGPNCEAREGWETGDYTYLITDRAQIVAPGNEAAYLAMPKDTQREYNAFLRASTGGDDPSIIRNGYVLDFTYYQSRFSLATPDIVVLQLGTNDIRDRDEPTLSSQFYSEMKLLIQRIRAAWANAKIILSLPNAAADEDRDGLWQNEYAPVIRKLMQLRADFASDGKVFLAPTWALATSEAGYSITTGSATTDDLSGGLVGLLADDIHPQYAARYQLAHALSAYIACAADNII